MRKKKKKLAKGVNRSQQKFDIVGDNVEILYSKPDAPLIPMRISCASSADDDNDDDYDDQKIPRSKAQKVEILVLKKFQKHKRKHTHTKRRLL